MTIQSILTAAAAAYLLGPAFARTARGKGRGFLRRVHTDPDGRKAKYVLFVPHAYTANEPVPLILFLHGMGESGTDGHKPAEVGLGPAIRQVEETFPFVAIFPQSQLRTWQAGSPDANRALAILAATQKAYNIDAKRLYLTGLSMGGFGTWSLAARHPTTWAAIAPVCGGGDPRWAEALRAVPCWAFHGDADRVVPVEHSRRMVEALAAVGAAPRYTELAGVGHNSWDAAYGDPELYEWLLAHRLQ